jgi:Spy/CpxP family protein refolding chaperone
MQSRKSLIAVALAGTVLIIGLRSSNAQHSVPGPGAGSPPDHTEIIRTYATAFDENVAAGRGFGMAFVADQNGYPGPLHVLELKDRLRLSGEQEATVETMLAAMFAESRPKGRRLLEAEAKLRRLFETGQADEAAVRAAVAEVEQARAEVRLVHLMFHLKTREVLTDEQRRRYHEARWSAHRPMGPHGAGPHGAGPHGAGAPGK